MKLPHRYLPASREDLLESVRYFESRQPGLGGVFLDEIDAALEQICQHPKRTAQLMRGVRKRNTERFQYGIIYTVAEDTFFILAIGGLRRRPGWWKSRLKGVPRE